MSQDNVAGSSLGHDVLIYLVALANKCHVDLPSAALRKIEKNRLKYPAKQVYGSSKKYTENACPLPHGGVFSIKVQGAFYKLLSE
uniref:Uncharacterized protein n=1 Tax=Pseudonaja textilis TaxID=8673 RepID=A0A670YL63_PSETE